MLFDQKTIFVIGGAGFIGSAVVRHLLEQTHSNVVNIDKLTYAANLASIRNVFGHPRYAFSRTDICDGADLRTLFDRYQPQAMINLAAESHVDRSIDSAGEFVQTNVIGTFTLLQEALRYWRSLAASSRDSFRFLHVSTDEVYGAPQISITREGQPQALHQEAGRSSLHERSGDQSSKKGGEVLREFLPDRFEGLFALMWQRPEIIVALPLCLLEERLQGLGSITGSSNGTLGACSGSRESGAESIGLANGLTRCLLPAIYSECGEDPKY
jgi:GDP-mannose 4,6 dehydratase